MRYLAARMHACVGAARNGQLRWFGQPQHGGECRLEVALHGAQPGLAGPAGESGAVVPEVEADTNEPGTTVGGAGLVDRTVQTWSPDSAFF